jgi:DNA primase
MSSDYNRIKERLDIQIIIEQETRLTMKGKHLSECPFCSGHGCFSIDREKGLYKCFQCPAQGDIFSFLESYHNIDKTEALRRAAEFAEIALEEHVKKPRYLKLTTKERIFIDAAAYYHANALKNGGREYFLQSRGHKETSIAAMKCGWSDGGLVDHLAKAGFTDLEIKSSGLAKEITLGDSRKLLDFFGKGFAVFPHWEGDRVLHFTMKDPKKKHAYQLEAAARSKEWCFYNQGALSRYNEIIIVEGENDLLSVIDAGINHVISLIGQPSEEQIKGLKVQCAGKNLYLWMDNDEDPDKPLIKGKGYVRKLSTALQGERFNVRVIVYSGEYKDPDEFLQSLPTKIDRMNEINKLQREAIDYITWEIRETASLESLDKRLMALKDRNIFQALGDMGEAEKQVFIEKIEHLGFTKTAIEEKISCEQELKTSVEKYIRTLPNKREADPNHIAQVIFSYIRQKEVSFHRDRRKSYIYCKHLNQFQLIEIGNNRPFNSYMKRLTGLLPTKEPGKSVWESLSSEVYNNGRFMKMVSWIYTDRATNTIFISLNATNNTVLKISRAGIAEVQNGSNEQDVLLRASEKMVPVSFQLENNIRDGMAALKTLVFNSLTCEKEQRYLILCWFIMAFLLDFVPSIALMKFSGSTASGKTSAAKLLSLLLYGNEHLVDPSTAAMYAVSSQNPLLIVDNLESEDITKGALKFLLLSATKGGKEKRTAGTETETTEEIPRALVLVTAIEPFSKPELINRTYDIEFNGRWKAEDFIEDDINQALLKKRELILSAIIKMLQCEVLPVLERRQDYILILRKEYRNHTKNRTDEFLATMMLILEKLVRYIPYFEECDAEYGCEAKYGWGDDQIRRAWITYQDAKAKKTETGTSTIVSFLNGLIEDYIIIMNNTKREERVYSALKKYDNKSVWTFTHPDYGIELARHESINKEDSETGDQYIETDVEIIASSNQLVRVIDLYCKNHGLKSPYKNAYMFAERLKNDKNTMKAAGWELIESGKENVQPYWKKINGTGFWRFKNSTVRN